MSAIVALSFIASTQYSQALEATIDRSAVDIVTNAAPSIEHLSKARAELRHVQTLLHQALSTGSEAPLDGISLARDRYRAELQAARETPDYPGERELALAVKRDIQESDRTIDEASEALKLGQRERAAQLIEGELADQAERTSDSLSLWLELNAAHAREDAETIQRVRARTTRLIGLLDGVSALLAIAMGALLLRAVRHYTDTLRAHGELVERRADELEQFAGRVAHDILSPLSATSLALVAADRALPPESRARTSVARGLASLARVQRTVHGLLGFARAGAKPEAGSRAEIASVVADIVADARLDAGEHEIEVLVDPLPPCAVACSPAMLTSLLDNLVRNALKFTADREVRRVRIRVLDCGARVRVEVVDTGPGVPDALKETIFDPYVRGIVAGKPGIGLGLATVKRIAESHGGAVGVRSEIDKGSVFWFELPKAAIAA